LAAFSAVVDAATGVAVEFHGYVVGLEPIVERAHNTLAFLKALSTPAAPFTPADYVIAALPSTVKLDQRVAHVAD